MHQLGTDVVLGRYLLERLFPFQSFERYFLFLSGTVAASLVNLVMLMSVLCFFEVILHSSRLLRKLGKISSVS